MNEPPKRLISGRLLALAVVLLAFGTVLATNPAFAQNENSKLMDLIKARGKLVVGVKSDYPPWGGISEDTKHVGLEPDLAKNIADRLGVGLDLISVSSADRLSKVEDGTVDLVIATMGDNIKRRNQAGLLEPNYYASGVNILVHNSIKLRDWGELRGRKVCLTDGAYFNTDVMQRYLIDPVFFKGTRDTQLALEGGRCIGWAYDDTALAQIINDERWKDFYMPLKSILIAPWSVAVSLKNKDGSFARFVEDIIAEWHRTGYLLEKEAEWKIPESRFLVEQNKLFNEKRADGEFFCSRGNDGLYPIECLNFKLAKEAGKADTTPSGIRGLLVGMGVDFLPLKDDFVGLQLMKGITWTIILSLACLAGSLGFGIIVSMIYIRSPKFIKLLIDGINNLLRMTPPILNLYIIFFGIGGLVAAKWGVNFNAVLVSIVVFSLYAGASNATILIKALETVMKNRSESSDKKGLMPQAIHVCFTGLIANLVNIVKAIGIASVIAVPELVSTSNRILSENGNTLEMMNFLVIFYFLLVGIVLFLLNRLNTKVTKWAAAKS